MIKKLLKSVREYKKASILSPVFVTFEVIMEVKIPFAMAKIVDEGVLGGAGTEFIISEGLKMVCMALISLISGAGAARFAAKAGMGFGSNIRRAVFDKIQEVDLQKTMETSYIDYAMSVIASRALPDV